MEVIKEHNKCVSWHWGEVRAGISERRLKHAWLE